MPTSTKWHSTVTRYQWLVLVVASLGWVFDAFEGQIYNLTRADMLPDLLHNRQRWYSWADEQHHKVNNLFNE
jgi:uncharacterized membrane protein SpoIIM required for sporulation